MEQRRNPSWAKEEREKRQKEIMSIPDRESRGWHDRMEVEYGIQTSNHHRK